MAKPGDADVALSEKEKQAVDDNKHPRAQVLYEAIRVEGEQELARTPWALALSGLAAGMSMGFSLVAMALIRAALPDAPWAKLVVSFGYCVGFVIVIVARQQLFTENTLTPVIPMLQQKNLSTFVRMLRLWGVVLAANLLGTLAFAFVIQHTTVFAPDVKKAFAAFGEHALQGGFGSHFMGAVFSGWLIALMMWTLAGAEARIFIVVVITYLVGLGDLSHVIAGSTEAFYAVFDGKASWLQYVSGFLVPVALGNLIGGITLVAVLSHAQISADGEREPDAEAERHPEQPLA
ncbi:MAG: formate/nitrite transporter family protein [Polyangiaceae bacterium]